MHTDKLIRKVVVFLAFTLCLAQKMTAFETFKFSVAPKYAFQNGQINEFVISDFNGHIQSELNWDVQCLSLLGINATVGWEMVYLEVDCFFGIPKPSGSMYDSDWINAANLGMKTNYSESSNSVDYLGNLDLILGVDVKLWESLHIIPYAGISYSKIDFTANGGTYWYGTPAAQARRDYGDNYKDHISEYSYVPYNSPLAASDNLNGDVITYKRELFNYNLGLKAKYNFFTRFTASLDFSFAVFTQSNAKDCHILRNDDFLDKMNGFFRTFKVGTELDVKIWKGLSAGAGFNFTYLALTKGIDYSKKSSEIKYNQVTDSLFPGYTVSGGTSGYTYNIEAFVRYSF